MKSINDIIKKSIFKLGITMLCCDLVGELLYHIFFSSYYFSLFPVVVFIYFILGALTISIIAKATEGDKQTYVNIYMMIRVIKLMILAITCILFAFLVNEHVVSFFISFASLYVIYTIFETTFSIKLNKFQNEINKKQVHP